MAAEYGFVKPSYRVCANPDKIALIREFEVETAANVYPGRLVKKGSTDAEVVANDASSNFVGWVGFEQASLDDRPDTIDTIYVVNKSCPVLNGPGMVIRAYVQANHTVVLGAKLSPSATMAGALSNVATYPAAIALEAKTASGASTAAVQIWVLSLI